MHEGLKVQSPQNRPERMNPSLITTTRWQAMQNNQNGSKTLS